MLFVGIMTRVVSLALILGTNRQRMNKKKLWQSFLEGDGKFKLYWLFTFVAAPAAAILLAVGVILRVITI